MSYKIFVVDDEAEICRILVVFLSKKGFEVLSANSGQEALEILKKDKSINLMLLDMRMPGMGGAEVLQEMEKAGISVPVIVLTGSLSETSFLKDFSMVRKTELKPMDLNKLFEDITGILGSK